MLAFTFPGQGSQRPGMGAPWVEHPSWELVEEASVIAGRDVAHLLVEAGPEELTATRNAQLATFVHGLVVLDAVVRLGLAPGICAGHSLGEYTALVGAAALSFDEGVAIVTARGDAMQAAADAQPGTMAAVIGLDDDTAAAACHRADGEVWVANYNAPGQVVIAGTPEAVAVAGRIAREMGAKRVAPIRVGGAFHTPFMASARDRLRKSLGEADFHDPEVPVVANVDARPHQDAVDWPGLLSAQLCSPVRWHQSLRQLDEAGAGILVELGPGTVLTGLARRSLPHATALSVNEPADLDTLVEALTGEPVARPDIPGHQGEHLYISERMVVSTHTGIFVPAPVSDAATAEGEPVEVGGLLGHIGEHEVRSPFAGWLMGLLALEGERVRVGQPVAWLRGL